jgi:hypothetical protein
MQEKKPEHRQQTFRTQQRVKVVAVMPQDQELESRLEEMKKNDGHPQSCG